MWMSSWSASFCAQPRPAKPPPTITTRCLYRSSGMGGLRSWLSGEAFEQVVADPDGIRHRGERRVDRADAREEARVDDVEVVDLVGTAVRIQNRAVGVAAKPA